MIVTLNDWNILIIRKVERDVVDILIGHMAIHALRLQGRWQTNMLATILRCMALTARLSCESSSHFRRQVRVMTCDTGHRVTRLITRRLLQVAVLIGGMILLRMIVQVDSKMVFKRIPRSITERGRSSLIGIAVTLCAEIHLLRPTHIGRHCNRRRLLRIRVLAVVIHMELPRPMTFFT